MALFVASELNHERKKGSVYTKQCVVASRVACSLAYHVHTATWVLFRGLQLADLEAAGQVTIQAT